MVVDLAKCIGCWSCVMACKQEHFLPRDIFLARITMVERGIFPQVVKLLLPTLCNHCEDAPCVEACPTGATDIRPDGIVHVNQKKCIGCRSCVIACPYQHRSFLSQIGEYNPGQGFTPWEEMGRRLCPLEKGTVVKCNFCMERIDRGIRKGLKPGTDRDATPACVIACPTGARTFGDLEDPEDGLLELIQRKKGFPIHPEFGTRPSVYYLNY
jgi:Fe-S-cluster-containing dehydrogenase component